MPSARIIAGNGVAVVDLADGFGTRVAIADNDPIRASYSTYIPAFTPGASNPTDILSIQGSASRIVRLRSLVLSGTATTATNIQCVLYRRSSANTGGSPSTQTLMKRDANDDTPTATVVTYGANPSILGSLVGSADGGRLNLAPSANGGIDRLTLQFGWINDKCPVLRGVNDFLCLNILGGAWPSGGVIDMSIVLTED